MITLHKHARNAAQWVVDSVMGNGLAQKNADASDEGSSSQEVTRLARRAAAEGCVLLTNDGTLPLAPAEEVAVFGRCALDWFHMGYGSGGSVHPTHLTNLMDGLDAVGANYNRVLAEMYRAWCNSSEHAADPGWWGHWPTCRPEMPVTTELATAAAQTSTTALVVIGRCAGEDADLPLAPGGYYLTNEERALLSSLADKFAHVVVVLNTGNVIDLSWVEEFGDKISAVLMAWQGGMEAGNAVADVLFGKVNPTGRLACTIARLYEDYPSSSTFGKHGTVKYTEDVFVGYRHFDTRAPERVLFSFGHGLSYTHFESELTELELVDKGVHARIRIMNMGPRTGAKTVLLWCEPPTSAIERPVRVLAAFGRTPELRPGDFYDLDLLCDTKTIARYDEGRAAFVLEAGSYQFDCTGTVSSVEVEHELVVEQCHRLCTTSEGLRKRIEANLPAAVSPVISADVTFEDVRAGRSTIGGLMARLSDEELEALSCGEGTMNSKLGAPGNAGAFGGVTPALRARGIPAAICADGPSGARLQRRCSLLPCATALACTFNTALVQELFDELGHELRETGVDVLLAPGMNIQRNPRCGRNFEYFSEDPLVSGQMAAAVVRGLQGAGISACPKHFACNNQEARRNTSDSRVSERALREIYLRGFEICVRASDPDLLMTSYNKVNGVWAHYHYDLATTVLREEWGFEGALITDWWMKPAKSPEFPALRDNAYRLRAGVDVLMPGSMSHVLQVHSRPAGISRGELQRTARRVLAFLLKRAERTASHP